MKAEDRLPSRQRPLSCRPRPFHPHHHSRHHTDSVGIQRTDPVNFQRKERRTPPIVIVSLIDILAILLIFFIVTTTFRTNDSLLQINLPKASNLGDSDNHEPRVSLVLGKDGQISFDQQIVPIEALSATLKHFRTTHADKKIELKADEATPLGIMVKVWEAATKAGVEVNELPLRISIQD